MLHQGDQDRVEDDGLAWRRRPACELEESEVAQVQAPKNLIRQAQPANLDPVGRAPGDVGADLPLFLAIPLLYLAGVTVAPDVFTWARLDNNARPSFENVAGL